MTTLLRIDASARKTRSLTRALGDRFIACWLAVEPAANVVFRDVGTAPPPIVTEDWIAAVFCDADKRTAEQSALLRTSDALIDELARADIVVMATPMYNYGMPAALKAWVDQVVRIGKTFTFDLARGDRPLEPIMDGKTLVMLTSSGEFGFGAGAPNAGSNHLTPHIETVSKYLGVETVRHIGIEYQEFGDDRFAASKAAAEAAVPDLVAALASRKRLRRPETSLD